MYTHTYPPHPHANAQTVVVRSQWYRDLAAGKSALWCNEVSTEWRFFANRYCYTRIRYTESSVFELQIFFPNPKTGLICIDSGGGMTLSLIIPLQKVVLSISHNIPAHLPAFLCEIITNRFSKDTHNHIVDYTDIQLPGAGSEIGDKLRYWRTELLGEVPRLTYLVKREQLFRGPVNRCHRFIAGMG